MPDKAPYREALLHWVWETRNLDLNRLETAGGKSVTIYDTGLPNFSDGPDFLNACIQIGSMKWYGDIEIHWNEGDWKRHGHHTDANFNKVVLHVVYHPIDQITAVREDGTSIPTLCLEPFLPHSLSTFLDRSAKPDKLPCSGQIRYISAEAFHSQLEKAHNEYFEQKVNDLMNFYNPSLPISSAWKQMLAIGLFDGLGISQNRQPMQLLGKKMLAMLPTVSSADQLIEEALEKAGFAEADADENLYWSHKSCRPNNHPKVRIPQAAECLWQIQKIPFEKWLKNDIRELWDRVIAQIKTRPGLGLRRSQVLYGIVWLPAFFILGRLTGSNKCSSSALRKWKKHHVKLPESLLKAFQSLPLPERSYHSKLGAIHQLRSYCRPRKCQSCKVFKSVISS